MTELMARQVNGVHMKRCDKCGKAVKFGYQVVQGPTQGFFHSKQCLRDASDHMREIKGKEGIE